MENQATKKPMILVIEPDPLMLTGISAILDQQGYRCFLSRDLKVARKATETLAFDLFLLATETEIQPSLDAAKELRSHQNMQDVPVLFLASHWEENWSERLYEAGGAYFLRKPFEPKLLLSTVSRAVWMPHLVHARHQPKKAYFTQDWVRLS